MPRLKFDKKYEKNGVPYGSYMLALPKALIEGLGWKDGDEISVRLRGSRLELSREKD